MSFSMAEIVISETMDEAAVQEIRNRKTVHYDPLLLNRPSELRAALSEARALIVRNRTQVTADLLDGGKHLRAVGRLGVGLDNIDLAACKSRGITVLPATGANAGAVAEYVIATALILLRGAYSANAEVLAGTWPRMTLMGREIAGKQLGLVGFGSIARETAKRAAALGMTIAAFDPHVQANDPAWSNASRLGLGDLVSTSDVVSVHVPLMQETRGLLGPDTIARMKPGAILINTARGGIVDEEAAVSALRSGRISGAAFDVFENEPLDKASATRFEGVPNLILTPHIAGVTIESNVRVATMVARAVLRHLDA
jgi:(S)-sulfolactate dehydrogenase